MSNFKKNSIIKASVNVTESSIYSLTDSTDTKTILKSEVIVSMSSPLLFPTLQNDAVKTPIYCYSPNKWIEVGDVLEAIEGLKSTNLERSEALQKALSLQLANQYGNKEKEGVKYVRLYARFNESDNLLDYSSLENDCIVEYSQTKMQVYEYDDKYYFTMKPKEVESKVVPTSNSEVVETKKDKTVPIME